MLHISIIALRTTIAVFARFQIAADTTCPGTGGRGTGTSIPIPCLAANASNSALGTCISRMAGPPPTDRDRTAAPAALDGCIKNAKPNQSLFILSAATFVTFLPRMISVRHGLKGVDIALLNIAAIVFRPLWYFALYQAIMRKKEDVTVA